MSRVAKMPIAVPQGVDVAITDERITIKGANGTLERAGHRLVKVSRDGAVIQVAPNNGRSHAHYMSGMQFA